jgi:hypothetical protein
MKTLIAPLMVALFATAFPASAQDDDFTDDPQAQAGDTAGPRDQVVGYGAYAFH